MIVIWLPRDTDLGDTVAARVHAVPLGGLVAGVVGAGDGVGEAIADVGAGVVVRVGEGDAASGVFSAEVGVDVGALVGVENGLRRLATTR